LGEKFVKDQSFKPWHFDATYTTADEFSLEACNYFGDNPDAARVRYLTPLDFPQHLPQEKELVSHTPSCGSISVPTLSLKFPEIVLLPKRAGDVNWTDAIPISRRRPNFGPEV